MEINLDTERLQDMMNLLQDANDSIDSAANKLLSVTAHNGWACKERYTINDYILENRNLVKALQSDCSRFCAAAKAAADDFVETEGSISQMFSSVEGALAQILANPVVSIVLNTSSIVGIASTILSGNKSGTDGGVKVPDPFKSLGEVMSQWGQSPGTGMDSSLLDTVPSLVDLNTFELNGN